MALAAGQASASHHYRTDPRGTTLARVSLGFGNQTARVKFDDTDDTNTIDTSYLNINFLDDFGENLILGVGLGYLSTTMGSRPATSGINFSGFNLRLDSDWHPPLGSDKLRFQLMLGYGYYNNSGGNDEQSTSLYWNEFDVRTGLVFSVKRFVLRGGAVYHWLNGKETTSGTIDGSSGFSLEQNYGGYAAVEFTTDPGGFIGLSGEASDLRRWQIYFIRYF